MIAAWATRLTSESRGAIAVIRVWGNDAIVVVDRVFRVAAGKTLAQTEVGRLRLGRIGLEVGDEAVAVIVSRDPPEVEIHGHGGSAVTAMTLAALAREGVQMASALRRVSLEQDAEIALAACSTIRSAEILLDQTQGALRRDLESISQEVSIESGNVLALLDDLISRGEVGVRLVRGWSVVLTGRPNVGKSRLLNALAGFQRAIVSDIAGTTRDVVTCRTAMDGWPVELSDTAGLHESNDALELAGMGLAEKRLASADLVLVVRDQSEPLSDADQRFRTNSWPNSLLICNKADLPSAWKEPQGDALRVSAATGEGIERLVAVIASRLVPRPPLAGQGVPFRDEMLVRLTAIRRLLIQGQRDEALRSLRRVLSGDADADDS